MYNYQFNYILSIAGVVYLFFSIIFRHKVSIYHRSSGMVVLQKEMFFRLQLKYALINSSLMIILGLLTYLFKVPFIIAYLSLLLFHVIHSLFRRAAERLGLVQYNR